MSAARFDVVIPIGTEPLVRGKESCARPAVDLVAERHGAHQAGTGHAHAATAALRGVQPQIREATIPDNWRPEDKAGYLTEPFTLIPSATGSSGLRSRYSVR